MTLEIPDWLASVAEVAAGHFPEADEDALWRLRDAYDVAATAVQEVAREGDTVAGSTMAAMMGQANLAFDQYWRTFSAGDGAYLTQLEHLCTDLAQTCDSMALETEYTKLSIIAALVALVAQIAALVASSFATFGAASTAIPAAMAGTRAIVMALLRAMLTEILKTIAAKVATTVGLQGIQVLEGHRSLGQLDVGKVVDAVTSGAIEGAIGGATGFGADKLGAHVLGAAATRGEHAAVGAGIGSVKGVVDAEAGSVAQGNGPVSGTEVLRGGLTGSISGAQNGYNTYDEAHEPPAAPTPAPGGHDPAATPPAGTPPAGTGGPAPHPVPPAPAPHPAPPAPTPAAGPGTPVPASGPPDPAGGPAPHPAPHPAPGTPAPGTPAPGTPAPAAAGPHPAPPAGPHPPVDEGRRPEIPDVEATELEPDPADAPQDPRPIPALNLP